MIRIGSGFDVHAFGGAGPVVLGGVRIPHERGLIAHSDGDVVLHAVADALLGALALGDIGHFYPDSDERYRNIDSRILLRDVVEKVRERGFATVNLDVTVMAQAPRLEPHKRQMAANIASDLGVAPDCVSVKATTTEKLGFTGRGEGIAVSAVVLVKSTNSSSPGA